MAKYRIIECDNKNNSKLTLAATKEQFEFIKSLSNCINGEWYFIPYWFKDIGNNQFEMRRLGDLPEELTDILLSNRELIPPPTEQ